MPVTASPFERSSETPRALRAAIALGLPAVAALTVVGTYFGKEILIFAAFLAELLERGDQAGGVEERGGPGGRVARRDRHEVRDRRGLNDVGQRPLAADQVGEATAGVRSEHAVEAR